MTPTAAPVPVRFPAAGASYSLAGSLFEPTGAAQGAVLIAGAMGVPQRFYAGFANLLRERGVAVLTFDYHGIGASAPASLRGFEASIHGWGEQDLGGAVDFLQTRFPGVPVQYVGHSVGGQLLGLVPRWERLDSALLIASQSGFWRLWPGATKYAMWLMWNAAIPVLTGALGFFPMGRLGQGEDLPAGVAREWAKWGRHPKYVISHAEAHGIRGYAEFDRPLRSVAIADDSYAPVPTVRALYDHYLSAPKDFVVVDPRSVGAKKIGHFGFFRSRFRDTLWADAAGWLAARRARAQ